MRTEPIKIVKNDERGIIYRTGPVNYIARKKGTTSADHRHEEPETLYIIKGKAKLTIEKETELVEAPIKVYISGNTYHKLVALTDIIIVRE